MSGWYGNVYGKAPTPSIQIPRTKNMRLGCGQQRGTSNPVSCDIAPLKDEVQQDGKNANTSQPGIKRGTPADAAGALPTELPGPG